MRDVPIGRVATAALFSLVKSLLGVYTGRSSVASAYATTGSLVLSLLWIYSAQILFLEPGFT